MQSGRPVFQSCILPPSSGQNLSKKHYWLIPFRACILPVAWLNFRPCSWMQYYSPKRRQTPHYTASHPVVRTSKTTDPFVIIITFVASDSQVIRLSWVLLHDLTMSRLSRNSPLLTEPKGSSPFSQQPHQWTITWARQIQSRFLHIKEPW
jgi:hypothetical protein